jgi:hypothetical protein
MGVFSNRSIKKKATPLAKSTLSVGYKKTRFGRNTFKYTLKTYFKKTLLTKTVRI